MDKHAIRSRALRHGFTLRPQGDGSEDLNDYVYSFAAEVFEAGKRAVAAERHEQQAAGTHPAPCARHCEANAFQIEIRGLTAAHASAWEAGKKLAQQALKAERERDALRLVCGEAYQMAGALDAPTKALDNLLAASTGAPLPHETFLPALSEESEIEKERDTLAAELKAVRGDQSPTVEDINLQEWKGMDGACAWHLIDRHADDWNHIARLMNAWLQANREDLVAELKALREQEPVAWMNEDRDMTYLGHYHPKDIPLYAHPVPARELTDAIIGQIYIKAAAHIEHATQREIAFARAIERHLRGDAP